MKKFKFMIALMSALLFTGVSTVPMYAQNNISTETVTKIETVNEDDVDVKETEENEKESTSAADKYTQKVTVDEVGDKIVGKVQEVIDIIQQVGLPLCLVCFIVSVLFTVFGCIAKKSVIGKGILAMSICIVCYTLILYAQPIVEFFSAWLAS